MGTPVSFCREPKNDRQKTARRPSEDSNVTSASDGRTVRTDDTHIGGTRLGKPDSEGHGTSDGSGDHFALTPASLELADRPALRPLLVVAGELLDVHLACLSEEWCQAVQS